MLVLAMQFSRSSTATLRLEGHPRKGAQVEANRVPRAVPTSRGGASTSEINSEVEAWFRSLKTKERTSISIYAFASASGWSFAEAALRPAAGAKLQASRADGTE